jgi:hypothetical protein
MFMVPSRYGASEELPDLYRKAAAAMNLAPQNHNAILADGLSLEFTTPVTFFVGENGAGKSTVLEAIAWNTGFASHGGSRDHQFLETEEGRALGRALTLSWCQRSTDGFYLRAETFHQFSSHLRRASVPVGKWRIFGASASSCPPCRVCSFSASVTCSAPESTWIVTSPSV